MKGRRLFALAALALAFGCRDGKVPTAPEQRAVPTDPSEIISDGAHNGGNPDFFFMPPMVPLPIGNANFELGKFNNTLKGSLKIDICELNAEPNNGLPKAATGCARTVKTFAPGSVNVVNLPLRQNGWWNLFNLPPDGFYYALWDTRQSNLNVTKYYRIKVYIAGSPDVLLGIADVDPIANLFQWKYTLTNEVIQLIDDVQLPIVFRVEKGGGPALCGAGAVCNSVTVTNNSAAGFQTVTVDGGSGAVAGAKFPNGWLPAGGPQSVVVTISSVNTGSSNPATGTETTPCHANLPLQQFRGCFNFTTTPRLASTNDAGDQFATPVTVAVCYVLQGTGDPREKFAEMWASGPNEPPHPLEDASDVGILSPATRNCSNSIIGFNNSKGVSGFASAGWKRAKGGFDALFGVRTAYGVDLGLGGITKKFSNIGPALSARLDTVSATQITVPNGGIVTPFVRIVGSNHHDGEHQNSTGLGGLSVSFVASATTGLSPQGADPGTATQLTAITNTLPINVENPTSGGGFAAVNWNVPSTPGTYTLTATGPTINGPVTFTAVVPETPPAPIINFETYPPGAGVCDGQGACSVTDEFESLGVIFSFSNPDLTASLCRTIHGPVGEGSNYGVSPHSTDCTGWNNGTVTMTFSGHPTTVEFTLEGNNLGPPAEGPFPVTALDTQGNVVVVDRTDEVIYQDQFEQAFRRETRRVTSSLGIASISVDSNVSVRIIDNLRIVP